MMQLKKKSIVLLDTCFERIEIGYISLMEFGSQLFERNVIVFIRIPLRNDLLKLFGSKSLVHYTSDLFTIFSK